MGSEEVEVDEEDNEIVENGGAEEVDCEFVIDIDCFLVEKLGGGGGGRSLLLIGVDRVVCAADEDEEEDEADNCAVNLA